MWKTKRVRHNFHNLCRPAVGHCGIVFRRLAFDWNRRHKRTHELLPSLGV